MFDINGSHIAQLYDTDLRTLVTRLCEAELRKLDLPVSAVIAGGNQNAADGGLDVRVELPQYANISGFIPRSNTGFQVKVPDMPPARISEEMCPKGKLRSAIKELASASGAYIIISAKGSTSDTARQNRCKAMQRAVSSTEALGNLTTDFYDRERLASWVRYHPGVILWVRNCIGQPINGWKPYENWANPREPADAEYILDNTCRMYDWRSLQDGEITVSEGIDRIKQILTNPKGVVRLVGLSGTGKTRLVQALFDKRVSGQGLDPSLAVYTDVATGPNPSPRDIVHQLVQNKQRAILVIDNCPPDTHRALGILCSEPESLLSLVSIEYDVADDEPEGTEVFRIEPASNAVIEEILKRQTPKINAVNRKCITEFSGGNARVALALAHTVRRGDNIANLTDGDLFQRLFLQRGTPDSHLLLAAEVCSLVYSFDPKSSHGESAELLILERLATFSHRQMFVHLATLRKRGLLQQRGFWQAILPHALANRLARQCIEKLPIDEITATFVGHAPARLLQSFSRRLGYLHDCAVAQQIVESWLSPGGLLSNIHELGHTEMAVFRNIAPVSPESSLKAIERAAKNEGCEFFLSTTNLDRYTCLSLLQSIAYDPKLFTRATLVLADFLAAESPGNTSNSAESHFKALFQIQLSGTHASIAQRLDVIDILLKCAEPSKHECGLIALHALFETHFYSSSSYTFGTRSRDFGWNPQSMTEVVSWYQSALTYAKDIILSDLPFGPRVKSMISERFRSLWDIDGLAFDLESMAMVIAEAQGFWVEGWIAVRSTLRLDAKRLPPEAIERLRNLEKVLRPRNLLQTVRAYLFAGAKGSFDVADGDMQEDETPTLAYEHANEVTEYLGRDVAVNNIVLDELLPDLFQGDINRGWYFGNGLAQGTNDLSSMWNKLLGALSAIPQKKQNILILRGFLDSSYKRDPKATDKFLDDSIEDPILGFWFPVLQASVHLGESGVERMKKALQLRIAPSWVYQHLAYSSVIDGIPMKALRRIILDIAALPDGFQYAIDILGMSIHFDQKSRVPLHDELILCGRDLLKCCTFRHFGQMTDYHMGKIIDLCFAESNAAADATIVCRRIKTAILSHETDAYYYSHVLSSLFKNQTMATLDEFVGDDLSEPDYLEADSLLFEDKHPLDATPLNILLAWAYSNPSVRFLRLSSVMPFISRGNDDKRLEWAPNALHIIHQAPNRLSVLVEFGSRFEPNSWSGSWGHALEQRRSLPQAFMSDTDPTIATWAKEKDAMLAQMAEQARLTECEMDTGFE